MTVSAQREEKVPMARTGNLSALLRKNVPAPADKQVRKVNPSIMLSKGLRRAPLARASANAIIWDFESEDQFNEWTIVDNDGDGFNWKYYNNEGLETGRMTAHEGNGLVSSASYDNESSSVLTPDNWFISPEVTLGGTVSFWACGQDASWAREVFAVYVCAENSTNPDDFVKLSEDITAEANMTEYEFGLSAYEGMTGRFAIRHYNVSDQFMLNIDDVCLDVAAQFVPAPTIPANLSAAPAATTADVSWDGADGDSWNLRYRVYNPNESQYFLWDLTMDNYETQIGTWSIDDRDNDGNNWQLSQSGYDPTGQTAEEDNVCFFSQSYDQSIALDPDNWLVTPELKLGGTFKFWAMNYSSGYPDKIGVFVMTDEGEFQIGDDIVPPTEWTEYTFDTSGYDGFGTIAIRHYDSYDQYRIFVDYISYEKTGDEAAEWIEVNGLTDPNYTIEGLEPGTEYIVEVQAYTEKGSTSWVGTHFTTGINVRVGAPGYSTLYYGEKNLIVPDGVEASAITVEGHSMTQSHVYVSGDIIPQGTGVLLQAMSGDHVFGVTTDEGTVPEANMLRGSDEAEETTGGDVYLMLSLNANRDPESVGFYYGTADGGPFVNGAHKAYLALTEEQMGEAKHVWFDTTGINSVETTENHGADVYTITGVHVNRLSALPKGIYIVGGKKIFVR